MLPVSLMLQELHRDWELSVLFMAVSAALRPVPGKQ